MKYLVPMLVLTCSVCVACGEDADDGTTNDPLTGGGGTGGTTTDVGTAGMPGVGGSMEPVATGGMMDPGGGDAGSMNTGGSAGENMGSGGEGTMGGSGGEMPGDGGSGGEQMSDAPTVEVTMMPTGAGGPTWMNFSASAKFVEEDGKVTLTITAMNCPDGEHAWHIHTNGNCGMNGDAAGGHWAVQGMNVGEQMDALTCTGGAGTTSVSVDSDKWTLGAGDFSLRGHSIMVHENGMASPGPRMACAVIPN